MSQAIRAARNGQADPKLAGIEALARELGRSLDVAAEKQQLYAVAPLSKRLLETLESLHLLPPPPVEREDPIMELLRELSNPSVLDSED